MLYYILNKCFSRSVLKKVLKDPFHLTMLTMPELEIPNFLFYMWIKLKPDFQFLFSNVLLSNWQYISCFKMSCYTVYWNKSFLDLHCNGIYNFHRGTPNSVLPNFNNINFITELFSCQSCYFFLLLISVKLISLVVFLPFPTIICYSR